MTRRIRFSGFAKDSEVTLSAAQGGVTRGPITVDAWQAASPVAATVSYGPSDPIPGEVVTFYVSETTGYSGPDEFRDLDFEWDFGDPGSEYTVAEGLRYTDANTEYGRVVAHAYSTSGAKTITLTIRQRVNGVVQVVGSETVNISVQDISGGITLDGQTNFMDIYWDPSNTFTGAPAHDPANRVYRITDRAGWDAIGNIGRPTRLNLCRGQTYDIGSAPLDIRGEFILVPFGTGAQPIMDVSGNISGSALSSGAATIRWIFQDIEVRGGYNPVTGQQVGTGSDETPKFVQIDTNLSGSPNYISFHKCRFRGLNSACRAEANNFDTNNAPNFFGFTDCDIKDWRDYGIAGFGRWNIFGIVGNSILQHPLALVRDNKHLSWAAEGPNHGPLRLHAMEYYGICNNNIASNTGWSQDGPAAYFAKRAIQAAIRANPVFPSNAGQAIPVPFAQAVGSVLRNRVWGAQFINLSVGSTNYQPLQRCVVDANEVNGIRSDLSPVLRTRHPGMHARNNVYYGPKLHGYLGQSDQFMSYENSADPTNIYEPGRELLRSTLSFNTVIVDRERPGATPGSQTYLLKNDTTTGWDTVNVAPDEVHNLVRLSPMYGNQSDYEAGGALDPADDFKPVTGNTAVIDAVSSGDIPVRDFDGNIRGSTTNKGAHDVESAAAGTVAAPVHASAPTIAELASFPGDYHVTDIGLDGDERYLIDFEWAVDGVVPQANQMGYYNVIRPADDSLTGSLTCRIIATNRSGTLVSSDPSNSITVP